MFGTVASIYLYRRASPMFSAKKYEDTRRDYAPLADGEKYLAPGQTEPVTTLIKRGRMVPVPLGRIEETR